MEKDIQTLQELIQNSTNIVFFGGAGVSTESGIKDFRSKDGLYHLQSKYGVPYEEMLSSTYFFLCVCFYIPHLSGIMWYLSFSIWLISLSIIPLRSTEVTNGKTSSFLWLSNILLCIYTACFISSFVDGHLGCSIS